MGRRAKLDVCRDASLTDVYEFWDLVYQDFKARELTRADLTSLTDIGLRHTKGSYRALPTTFRMPPTDYRRFHAFLYQPRCNLPVTPYRRPAVCSTGLLGRTQHDKTSRLFE